MGWKKRAGEHVIAARNALDDADDVINTDVAASRKIDILVKHVCRGFVESALALAEAYGACDVEGKRTMRGWVGGDVVDAAVALSISRGPKKEAA
jgi:hypothetical protein